VISKINPVRFKWNGLWGHANDNRDIVGIIGQELESVAPYTIIRSIDKLYAGGPETEIIQVDPTPLIYLLINAVKDLSRQINDLEKRRSSRPPGSA
jgi:hypothetical protein